jgi:lipopolysaccharide transport system permease protein
LQLNGGAQVMSDRHESIKYLQGQEENVKGLRTSWGGWNSVFIGLWQYRELMRSLVVRNLKVKYQRSFLGFVWTLLNPMLTAGVLIAVFSHIIRIQTLHYWAFLLSGYFVWNFTSQLFNAGAYILVQHGPLRRSVAFPMEVLIFSAAISRLVEFAFEITMALLAIVLLHHGHVPSSFLLLPFLILLQVLIAIGLVMVIATLAVFFQDMKHIIPIATLLLFYISPVFYPASFVPEAVRNFYYLNPIAGMLTLFHTVIYEGQWPSIWFLSALFTAAILINLTGYAIFNRYKDVFPEII